MKKTLALAEDHRSYFLALATIEEDKLIAMTDDPEAEKVPVVNKTESQKPIYRTGLKKILVFSGGYTLTLSRKELEAIK